MGIFPPPEIGGAAFFGWIVPEYRFDPQRIWLHGLCCYSSETLFGVLSLPVGLLLSPPGRFELEAIGVVNLLGFVAAFWLLLLALRPLPTARRVFGGLLLLLIFTDVAYVSLFNSFYTEPAALIFLLASLGLALVLARRPDSPPWLPAGLFVCAALLATSRPQNAWLGVLFAALGIRLTWHLPGVSRRRLAVAAAVLVSVVSLWYFRHIPGSLGRIHLYNAVFRELLVESPDPRRDLAELGLPPELDRLVGSSGFSRNAPIADPGFQRVFFRRVGYGKLARFYATRPRRLWRAFERTAIHALEMRPLGTGNYARETGKPEGSLNESFAVWSRAKERLAPAGLWFVIAYLFTNLIAALALCLRARDRAIRRSAEIWIAVVLVAAFQFSVSAVMDHESRRSLFLFNAAFDILFTALCLAAASLRLSAGTVFASERAGWEKDGRTARPSGDGVFSPLS